MHGCQCADGLFEPFPEVHRARTAELPGDVLRRRDEVMRLRFLVFEEAQVSRGLRFADEVVLTQPAEPVLEQPGPGRMRMSSGRRNRDTCARNQHSPAL